MKKFIVGALTVLFSATAAGATHLPGGQRSEIDRLQAIYDEVEKSDGADMISHVIITPHPDDEATLGQYLVHDNTSSKRVAAFMSRAAFKKFNTDVEAPLVAAILDNHSGYFYRQKGAAPTRLHVNIINRQKHNNACFAFMPEKITDLKKEILAFIGMEGYTGNNGIHYDGSNSDHPFEYDFDIPISIKAWQSFKTHYNAALCLIDFKIAALQNLDEHSDNTMRNAQIAFAAVMAARDGYPEVLPFLADFMAATMHNLGSYRDNYNIMQLVENGANTNNGAGTSWRGSSSGGFQIMYPVFLLDQLAHIWDVSDKLKIATNQQIFPSILEFAANYSFNESEMRSLTAIIMPFDKAPAHMIDPVLTDRLQARSKKGAKKLGLCITPSKTWQEYGEQEGKDFWAQRNKDYWTPPVCRKP
jgi:hypothetical protein